MSIAIKVGKKSPTFHWAYESDVKDGKAKYFVRGEGWKRGSAEIVTELPKRSEGSKMNWLQIAKLTDQYGLNIGEGFADCKVAGIVARQTAAGYCEIYRLIKDIITDEDWQFFEILKCDYMLSCFGIHVIDIVALDELFAKLDPEYDNVNCTYKGEKASMSEYVTRKYGERHTLMISKLVEIHKEEKHETINSKSDNASA